MDQIILVRQVFGKNSNRYSNKNSSIYILEKKALNLKIGIRIDIRIYYHVIICTYFGLQVLNILFSVDHTRVRLKDADPNIPGSDYINANYIKWDDSHGGSELPSDPSGKIYIATQGKFEKFLWSCKP